MEAVSNPVVATILLLVMIPLATTELGTDGWVTALMEPAMGKIGPHAGWIIVYTSLIMTVLRFFAGPIVHKLSPIGLLAAYCFFCSMPESLPLLVAADLAKSYGSLKVLSGVSLTLGRGESVAILGASGSGKTTLLSLLAALDKPDGGRLEYAGENLLAKSEPELAHWRGTEIGVVFQEYHLVPALPAWENVTLPLDIAGLAAGEARRRAAAMLDRVGLRERSHHFPHQLSGGEQQRVAIARALVTRPKLLFADEPTGNLDEKTAREIEDLLFQLAADTGLTMVVVTHNQTLADRCHRSLGLHLGRFA